ncbi:MAG: transglutaminase-like cysteine peptidase [Kiloniellaceae bacterium]
MRGAPAVCAALVLAVLAWLAPTGARSQTLADLANAARGAPTGLFGSTEIRAETLQGLPQWTRVLANVRRDRAGFADCSRDAARCTTPTLRQWRQIITKAAGLGRKAQLKAVNDFFNRWPYKQDWELYGRQEYWATPSEFMARSGDCEDYAIAKYFALRQLGWSKDDMRIVILMDRIRAIGHAVLAVYLDDRTLILDSLSNLILPHDRYKHYLPQYSMNETTRWAHIGGYRQKSQPVYRGLAAR